MTMPFRTNFFAIFLLLILTFLVYWGVFSVPFYLDDYDSIVNNLLLKNYSYPEVFSFYPFRQISYVSFAFIQQELQGDLNYFHALSLLIHSLNAALLTFLTQLILKHLGVDLCQKRLNWASMFAGLLFLVLPLNSQAVVYIVQLPVLFACFFYLLTIVAYIQFRLTATFSNKVLYLGLLLISIIFGAMSKQNFFSFPVALFLVEWLVIRKIKGKQLGIFIAFAILILLILHVLDFALQSGIFSRLDSFTKETTDITRWQYFTHQITVIPIYLYKVFIPHPLMLEYPITLKTWSDWQVWASLVGFIVVIKLILSYRNQFPIVLLCVLLYLTAHLIESSFIPITDLAFEHRAYLPNAFMVILISFALFSVLKNTFIVKGFTATILIVFSAVTIHRVQLWNEPKEFFRQNLTHVGDNSRAYAAVALTYANEKDYQTADYWYAIALQVGDETQRLSSTTVVAYMEMLQADGQIAKARILGAKLIKRIKLPRKLSLVYATLAVPHVNKKQCFIARGLIEKALSIHSLNKRALMLKELCDKIGYVDPLLNNGAR